MTTPRGVAQVKATRAMLAALELAESHIGWLWDHVEDRTRYERTGSKVIHDRIRAAIVQAREAGIEI